LWDANPEPAEREDLSEPHQSLLSRQEQTVMKQLMLKFQTAGAASLAENKRDLDSFQMVRILFHLSFCIFIPVFSFHYFPFCSFFLSFDSLSEFN
jgi:hypothetical protein